MNKKKSKQPRTKLGGIISDKVGNYENHPFFVKKTEEARAFIKKAGFPKEFGGRITLDDIDEKGK